MGMNMLGEKKVRFLRELTGLNIDRASTNSAVESGRWWEFRVIEEDSHWHGLYDRVEDVLVRRDDGSVAKIDDDEYDDDFAHWSSCADVPGGIPPWTGGPPQEPIATTGPLVPPGTP